MLEKVKEFIGGDYHHATASSCGDNKYVGEPIVVFTKLSRDDEYLYEKLEKLAKDLKDNGSIKSIPKNQVFRHQEFLMSQYRKEITLCNKYLRHLVAKGMFDSRLRASIQLIEEYVIPSILEDEAHGFKNVRRGRDVYVETTYKKKKQHRCGIRYDVVVYNKGKMESLLPR